MIDLYFANSGNSLRAVIALEECGLPYRGHKIDLQKREQKSPEFLKLNPFGVVPAMYDSDGPGGRPVTLTQSGAIMLYATEKAGRFMPEDPVRRLAALQWFMMAVSDASPANAIILYMGNNVPDLSEGGRAYLQNRFLDLMRGVEAHLAQGERSYLAEEISIADLALFPIVRIRRAMIEAAGGFPNLLRWFDHIGARPAIARAIAA
jgi:GST-like protein